MRRTWRFLLGATIGAGLGYAMVLLIQPAPKRQAPRWRSLYEAPREQREEEAAN